MPGSGAELETVLERFTRAGKKAGLVTTSFLTDATPAAYSAHEQQRSMYAAIAQDMGGMLFSGAAQETFTCAVPQRTKMALGCLSAGGRLSISAAERCAALVEVGRIMSIRTSLASGLSPR